VYLPSVRHTKHLSNSQRSDSFFGTDFSYEDIEPKRARDFEATYVGAATDYEGCREISVRSRAGISSTYDHMVACIEPERGIIRWIDYYRQPDQPFKRLVVSPGSIRSIGNSFIPFSMTMATAARQTQTTFETDSYELVDDIPDRLFNSQNLEFGDAKHDRVIAE
jgi:hypothetical protein